VSTDGFEQRNALAAYARVNLRPIGSPLPLGLLGLMVGGALLSLQQIGVLAPEEGRTIALILVGFVVPLMLLATIFSFLARDTIAATALGLFTGGWLATGLAMLSAPSPGATSDALGTFAILLSAALLTLIGGASFGKAGPALVIVAGAARFLLTGLYEIKSTAGLEHAAGIVGLLLVVTSLYSALATTIEDIQGHTKLPLGRRAKARDALNAPFDSQLERVEHEAGVRQQL
jgi:succinate-acetate transporter protein